MMTPTEIARKTLAYCLFPLTVWYGIGVWIRNKMFDYGLLKSEPSPLKSVGVGNLLAGGTGKTPHAEYLLQTLSQGGPVAFLSRGYHRQSRGFQLATTPDVALVGDEPAMIALKNPSVTVAVCESRREGLRRLAEMDASYRVVLDDLFQHRFVQPDVMVLLTEYHRPYYYDQVLPFGNLRESRSGRKRADIIVVTKCPEYLTASEMQTMKRDLRPAYPETPIFFSYYAYRLPESLPERVTLLTGIAHPEPLVQRLSALTQVELHRYADHHPFTQRELEALPTDLPICTTEKDAMRLRRLNTAAYTIIPIPIDVRFLPSERSFDEVVLSAIS